MGLRQSGLNRVGFRRINTQFGSTLAALYNLGTSTSDSTLTLNTTAGGLTLDGTGVAVEPLTILNGNAGSGIALKATGTARTGYSVYDATPTLRGTFGVAVSANDWFTGTAAGDVALLGSTGKTLHVALPSAAAANVSFGLGFGTSIIPFKVNVTTGSLTFKESFATVPRMDLSAAVTNTTGSPFININNDAGRNLQLAMACSATSAGTIVPTDAGSVNTSGTGGLVLAATNAAGFIDIITGGSTSGNRRVRIDASGRVGVNTLATTLAAKLTVNGGFELQGDTFAGTGDGLRGGSGVVKVVVGGATVATFNSSGLASGVTTFDGSKSVASAAGATWNGIDFVASTATVSGSTHITTATGFNAINIARPTVSFSGTVDHSASLYIANSPAVSGGGAITNPYALWVDDGVVRLDGAISTFGNAGPQITLALQGGVGPATLAQSDWLQINCDGNTRFIPLWSP